MRNILVISSFWPTNENPISGIFVVQQIKALCAAGCEVTIVVGRTIGKANHHLSLSELGLTGMAVRLITVPIPRLPEILSASTTALKLNILLTGMFMRKAVAPLLRSTDGCIVHGIRYFGLTLSRWSAGYTGKTVLFIHGVDPFLQRRCLVSHIRTILQRSDPIVTKYVLVGSPLIKHAAKLGIDSEKIVIVPNGTEIPVFVPAISPIPRSDETTIISVSNLVPLKGIDDNIRALALLWRQYGIINWQYVVVGEGPERTRLEELSQTLGLSRNIRFLGRPPYRDTMEEIVKADIFSLPSWGEAFGIVYLEAMARFKPAIGCLQNGAADIITDGEDGLLVPPKNPETLALALKRLIEDAELRAELGQRARLTAEGFTWDINATRVLSLLGLESQSCKKNT